jgi:hypothetical protein
VRTSTRICGAAAVAAGLMSIGAPAFADSADNDGVNLLNDNNTSILPIQLCDANLLEVAVPIFSPTNTNCVNAPLVDHPSAG